MEVSLYGEFHQVSLLSLSSDITSSKKKYDPSHLSFE